MIIISPTWRTRDDAKGEVITRTRLQLLVDSRDPLNAGLQTKNLDVADEGRNERSALRNYLDWHFVGYSSSQ